MIGSQLRASRWRWRSTPPWMRLALQSEVMNLRKPSMSLLHRQHRHLCRSVSHRFSPVYLRLQLLIIPPDHSLASSTE